MRNGANASAGALMVAGRPLRLVCMSSRINKKTMGAVAAVVLAIAVPVGVSWEGEELDPYKDAVGVWTVCSGATNVAMRRYSKAECANITSRQYARFRDEVVKVEPALAKEPWQWAAYTLFSSNVGTSKFSRSSILKLYRAGRFVDACRYLSNYKYAGGKVFRGLVFRRNGHEDRIGERELCLVGAVPAQLGIAQ